MTIFYQEITSLQLKCETFKNQTFISYFSTHCRRQWIPTWAVSFNTRQCFDISRSGKLQRCPHEDEKCCWAKLRTTQVTISLSWQVRGYTTVQAGQDMPYRGCLFCPAQLLYKTQYCYSPTISRRSDGGYCKYEYHREWRCNWVGDWFAPKSDRECLFLNTIFY